MQLIEAPVHAIGLVAVYLPDIYERPPVKLLPLFLVGVAKTNNINQRSLS